MLLVSINLERILTPEKLLVFRLTHLRNLPWILRNGIHCRNGVHDPEFHPIGNPEIIARRSSKEVPVAPGGTLDDYVPFYFTPRSIMLLNIVTGHGVPEVPARDLAILVAALPRLREQGLTVLYSDRHAGMAHANFHSGLEAIPELPWKDWQTSDFSADTDRPDKKERYQAEVLVHRHVPIGAIAGIALADSDVAEAFSKDVDSLGAGPKIVLRREWFFVR